MKTYQLKTIIGMFLVGIASSVLTIWQLSPDEKIKVVEHHQTSDERLISEQQTTSPLENSQLIEQFVQIHTQFEAINNQINEINKHLAEDNTSKLKTTVTDDITLEDLPGSQTNESNQQLEQHVALIANRFLMEETDTAWAGNMAVQIQDALNTNGLPNDTSINNVDCRTSMCKLDISFNDNSDLDSMRKNLLEKVGATLPYGAIQPGTSDNDVTIYLGKNHGAFTPAEDTSLR